MLITLLQLWGGSCYLLNKVFFSKAERATVLRRQQEWQSWAWIVYLAGLPPWVYIFVLEQNWIAAAVEASSVPAMLIGLLTARQRSGQLHQYRWLDHLARLMLVIGFGLSLYDFGGLTTLNQFLELGVAAGFLLGAYQLAKSRPQGYFWLMVGNVCNAWLMQRQGYFLLMTQQILSLVLIFDANRIRRQRTEG